MTSALLLGQVCVSEVVCVYVYVWVWYYSLVLSVWGSGERWWWGGAHN